MFGPTCNLGLFGSQVDASMNTTRGTWPGQCSINTNIRDQTGCFGATSSEHGLMLGYIRPKWPRSCAEVRVILGQVEPCKTKHAPPHLKLAKHIKAHYVRLGRFLSLQVYYSPAPSPLGVVSKNQMSNNISKPRCWEPLLPYPQVQTNPINPKTHPPWVFGLFRHTAEPVFSAVPDATAAPPAFRIEATSPTPQRFGTSVDF